MVKIQQNYILFKEEKIYYYDCSSKDDLSSLWLLTVPCSVGGLQPRLLQLPSGRKEGRQEGGKTGRK